MIRYLKIFGLCSLLILDGRAKPLAQSDKASAPVISVGNESLEGISIANKINQFFDNNNINDNSIQDLEVSPVVDSNLVSETSLNNMPTYIFMM